MYPKFHARSSSSFGDIAQNVKGATLCPPAARGIRPVGSGVPQGSRRAPHLFTFRRVRAALMVLLFETGRVLIDTGECLGGYMGGQV